MDDDHARAHLLHILVIRCLGGGIVGGPARNALLAELVEGFHRELGAFGVGAPLGRIGVVRTLRPQAKQFPGFLLGAKEGLGLEDLGIARPRSATALDRIADIHIMPGLQEKVLPARFAIGLGFPGDASQAAAVPQQQRIAPLAVGLMQLHELHIHLLDFKVAVRIDLEGCGPGGEHDLFLRQAGQGDLAAADVKAADLFHAEMIAHHPRLTAVLMGAGAHKQRQSRRANRFQFHVPPHFWL